jgi:hypothetical protein
MSETNSYKNITLTSAEAFAVARALRGRIEAMQALQAEAALSKRQALAFYSLEQLELAETALAILAEAPLSKAEGVKS